jgi:hypothetical protein
MALSRITNACCWCDMGKNSAEIPNSSSRRGHYYRGGVSAEEETHG